MEIILRGHALRTRALRCGHKGLEIALPSFRMHKMQSRSRVSGEFRVTVQKDLNGPHRES